MVESRKDFGIITNSVNCFKNLSFMLLTLAEKVQIKHIGRDTPNLTAPASSKGKVDKHYSFTLQIT